ncbi:TPM domain-containing protein [Methylobacterium gossipiicola]|uniref:Putative membrane protein n=1 Tax=Methylobacterium gossipiicola TaxID=582675 RepID=A0A1I2RA27_9HYPH|nr:TPM domain-containing protein [Methylobacterium gossipiicola]SFG34721.1 putative membrane protein [Methylobacterium gossipiicola]
MTGESILNRDALARIAEAVRRAEAATAGEIVVLIAARAGTYRSAPLAFALACGLLAPWPLILLTPWSAASICLAQACVVLGALGLGLHPRLRMALVPLAIREARAHEAARREFRSRGLCRTPDRTGILIYLACAEGHAEIVADSGIAARVPAAAWQDSIGALLAALRRGDMEAGLLAAVERVGAILAAELPGRPDDPDLLPNRVIVVA